MDCPICGFTLREGVRFCARCGGRVGPAPSPRRPVEEIPLPRKIAPPKKDRMKTWCIVFGIFLVASMFVPGVIAGKIAMFWNRFGTQTAFGVWHITNAILGFTLLTAGIIFGPGIVRGSIMAGCGVVGSALFLALVPVLIDASGVFFYLGLLCTGIMLGAVLLREFHGTSLTARITGGISGGVCIVLFILSIIFMLIKLSGVWSMIISGILTALLMVLGIIAGILCLVLIARPGVLKAAKTLLCIFFIGLVVLTLITTILLGASTVPAPPFWAILVLTINLTVIHAVITLFTLILGVGFAETLKEALVPTVG